MFDKPSKIIATFLVVTLLAFGFSTALAAPAQQAEGTIVDIAAGDEQFSTLVTALQTAELVETLQGEGPFTVFAPTNDAFDKLPEGTLEALLEDVPALTDILLYHVVDGSVMAADVVTLNEAPTLQGSAAPITVDGETVMVGDATVTTTDIEATNGVIHIIDTVLIPSADEDAMMEEGAMEEGAMEEEMMEAQTIVDIAASDEQFSTLVTGLQTAELVETLQGEGPFTVFAPTNDAFDKLPEGTLDSLLNDVPALTDILLYHVVDGNVMAADVVTLSEAPTLQGSAAPITIDGETVMVGDATVTTTDVAASNGVIHIIDTVLIPSAGDEAMDDAMMEEEMVDTPIACSQDYTVQADDWLSKLAERFYGDVLAFDPIVEATNQAAAAGANYEAIADPNVIEIGQVLCIPAADGTHTTGDDEAMMADDSAAPTVVDIAVEDGRFTTLVTALQAAELVETLQGEGPFTVFAPTDEAFAKLPEGTLEGLLADIPALTDILLYHVVEGKVMAADVVNLASADTIFGQAVDISVDGDSVMINDAQVVITDIEGSNGVIHVIDTVLIPSTDEDVMMEEGAMEEGAMEAQTIVDIAAGDEQFSTLVTALQAAELVETLQGEGPFTVFAPTNDAFDKLPEGTLEGLLEDVPALTDILLYHVVDGNVMAADVVALSEAPTLQGSAAPITVDGETVMVGDATVTTTDVVASNGVIHIIDTVLLPTN